MFQRSWVRIPDFPSLFWVSKDSLDPFEAKGYLYMLKTSPWNHKIIFWLWISEGLIACVLLSKHQPGQVLKALRIFRILGGKYQQTNQNSSLKRPNWSGNPINWEFIRSIIRSGLPIVYVTLTENVFLFLTWEGIAPNWIRGLLIYQDWPGL